MLRKRSGKENIMNFINGNTYRIKNQYYPNHALNVYGTNAASTGRNVCLYDDTPSDKMQRWVLKTCGDGFQLCSAVNNSYVLDCSDGSLTNSYKNNAHLCASSSTSATDSKVKFIEVSDDLYKIYLPGKNLYLTATNINRLNGLPASTIKTATALTGGTGGQSNVYWAAAATSENAIKKQCWTIEKYSDSSSGGGTSSGDTYTINGKTIPLSEWPVGSFWTTDRKPSDKDGNTSIKLADGSKQCAGFAKYVYEQIWGNYKYGQKVAAVTLEGTSEDFKGINVGARINCDRRGSKIEGDKDFTTSIGNHSMILLSKTSSGIVVYECNHDDKCGIGMRTITYRNFYLEYMNIKNSSYTP